MTKIFKIEEVRIHIFRETERNFRIYKIISKTSVPKRQFQQFFDLELI